MANKFVIVEVQPAEGDTYFYVKYQVKPKFLFGLSFWVELKQLMSARMTTRRVFQSREAAEDAIRICMTPTVVKYHDVTI